MAHLLAERYELTSLIGSGPTGEVWRARERSTRELLAVKMLDPHLSADPYTVDRFQRERHVLTAFLHLAYVRVRDLVAEDRTVALVMELVSGVDLRTRLDRYGPLAPAQAAEVAGTVAEALAAAHDSGVVHCDLKPQNVIMEDETGQVRLTDCRVGRLARGFGDGAARYAYAHYAAPEVIRGGPPVPATDVYALGMLLYEMLTGTTPYPLDDPNAVLDWHLRGVPIDMTDVPRILRPVLKECLRTEPAIRPTARQVVADLRRMQPALGGAPPAEPVAPVTAAPRPAHPDPPVSFVPKRPWRDTIAAPGGPWHGPPPPRGLSRYPVNVRIAVAAGAALLIAGAALLVAIGVPASGDGRSRGTGAGAPGNGSVSGGRPAPGGAGTGPSPATGAPKLPAAAVPYTLEGATAFVSYWFDTLTFAIGSGDIAPLAAASSPTCQACATVMQEIRASYQGGGSMSGGVYTVHEALPDGFWSLDKPQLHVVVDWSPRSKLGAGGTLIETFPPGAFVSCLVLLERANDRWRVLEVHSQARIA